MRVKKIGYYKKLSKIINDNINYMQYYRIKNDSGAMRYYYGESHKLIVRYFDSGKLSTDTFEYFLRRIYKNYFSL